jgi:hypothetical protein
MNAIRRMALTALGVTLTLGFGLVGRSGAHDGHGQQHGAPLHGGKVAMTKEYHFEVVFARDGLKVFPRTHEDQPIDASQLTGTAAFHYRNAPKPWFERTLVASAASPGQAGFSLGTTIDLSKVPTTGTTVTFQVEGLPAAAEPTATFSVPFALASSGAIVVAKATKADMRAITAQRVCPVSMNDLLVMGTPVKVSRGDKSIFLCCKACLKEIQANPDKFLAASAAALGGAGHEHHHH